MRILKPFSIVFLFIISTILISCDNEDTYDPNAEGELTLSFTVSDESSSTKGLFETEPNTILLSIKNSLGDYVINNEEIELYEFNDLYISPPISLNVGEYQLVDFMVLDNDANVIYAAPKEGSAKAYLVNDPLSIDFTISEDKVQKIIPEVLSTENVSPDDFGYSTFSFDIVETFNFLTTVFIYDETEENFVLTDANILIGSNTDTVYCGQLLSVTNLITINANYDNYTITISKSGYTDYIETFTKDSLKQHFSTPLTVILSAGNTLILQPNAYEGKDAVIGNCVYNDYINSNFGSHEEFTANAWTNSGEISTLRSLIDFDLSSLPSNSNINNAKLFLYTGENTTHGPGHSQESGSNECILQRITSTWEEYTVTWNTQPSVTTENQVELPASDYVMQNYEVDVTELIKDMINKPEESFGFMLRLKDESYYRRMLFVSSDYEDASKAPKLVITYE